MKTIFTLSLFVAVIAMMAAPPLSAQPQWMKLSSGSDAYLKGVHFVTQQRGYAAGGPAALLKTTDAGATWEPISVPIGGDAWGIYAVAGPAGDIIYIAGDNGSALKSTDGGANWIPMDLGFSEGVVFGLFGYDADNLCITGGEGEFGSMTGVISTSHDGGTTWTRRTIEGMSSFDKSYFLSPAIGYAAGASTADFGRGAIYRTTDGGMTWQEQWEGAPGALNSVHCVDGNTCTVGGFFGVVMRTTDGGTTWKRVTLPAALRSASFTHVSFIDAQYGYMSGANGVMARTTDGGATWESDPSFQGSESSTIWGMTVVNGLTSGTGTFYAVGDEGEIHKLEFAVPAASAAERSAGGISVAVAPNPVKETGVIALDLPVRSDVTVRLYDHLGREAAVIADGVMSPGDHALRIDARELASGIYHLRVEIDEEIIVDERIVVMR